MFTVARRPRGRDSGPDRASSRGLGWGGCSAHRQMNDRREGNRGSHTQSPKAHGKHPQCSFFLDLLSPLCPKLGTSSKAPSPEEASSGLGWAGLPEPSELSRWLATTSAATCSQA